MEKAKRIKVVQVANDLRMDAQEVADLMVELGHNVKKTGSLTEKEVNLLLDKITKENQSSDFEEFFSNSLTKETDKKPENEKNRKNSVKKKFSDSRNKEKSDAKSDKKQDNRNVKKANDKNNDSQNNQSNQSNSQYSDKSKNPKNKKNQKNQNTQDRQDKKVQQKKDFAEKNIKSEQKPAEKPQRPVQPKQEVTQTQHKKKDKKPAEKHDHGQRTTLGTAMISDKKEKETAVKQRTVDTRGSYVDLDKYNERYENIAPANKVNDNFTGRKQKINQKSQQYNKNQKSRKKKNDPEEAMRRLELERARKKQLEVKIPDMITVSELAVRLKATAAQVIKTLFSLGVMATINEEIDFDTASLVAEELGAKVEKEIVVTIEEKLIDDTEDSEESLQPRCPVVCIMGHVDHGKTSILDRIRNAHVTSTEAGGITQHIGAYQVNYNGKDITFLDTPGHEAFTSMRARGANITDIAILVVAADDGVMPQTIESINHAKAADIPVIVAINKMDAEGANPNRIKEELTNYGMVCEDWGGDVICVPVSAKTGEGIDDLLENILLVSEFKELKANPDRLAKGAVIEARLDKGRGPIATLLVQKGTLHKGDVIIAGTSVGRVRVMTNHIGRQIKEAGPSVPVEITGLAEVPSAGDTFDAVEDEKLARSLVEQRKNEIKENKFNEYHKVTLENLFSQIEDGEMKELSIVVKADVQGSAEAVKQSLEKLSNDEVRVRVIHSGVGAVKESDVMLANASNAIIVGFNVRPDPVAAENAKRDGVDIHLYRVIYDAIEEIQTAMKGMLAPKTREVELGRIEVRQVYRISNVGLVAGSYVLDGKAVRNASVRIVRDGIIIADDIIAGLKRFKDDAKEVAAGYECGISLSKFNDIKVGDIFEAYKIEEYRED